jgi:hypothetical protein
MANSDSERDVNQQIVDATSAVLHQAARNLTPEIEPAAVFSLAPGLKADQPATERSGSEDRE